MAAANVPAAASRMGGFSSRARCVEGRVVMCLRWEVLGGVGVMVWVNAEVFGSNTKDVKRSCFIVLPSVTNSQA